MLSVNSQSPWEMISGFNLTITRREKRQGMKLCSGLRTICDTSLTRGIDPTAGSLLSAISATPNVNDSPVRGNFNVVYWLVEFFFLSYFPDTRIEIIIKIKANFYKEIAQFTILVAIIGNKISKYYFLTCLSQIPYISTRQTYMGKFNSRDSAWYDLFSFSDTSSSQIITKETVARTIEPS